MRAKPANVGVRRTFGDALGCSARSGEADQAVIVGVAAVDDGRPFGLFVVEQEEVVSDELHLVERVVDRHRLGLVLLGSYHPSRWGTLAILSLGCPSIVFERLRRLGVGGLA